MDKEVDMLLKNIPVKVKRIGGSFYILVPQVIVGQLELQKLPELVATAEDDNIILTKKEKSE